MDSNQQLEQFLKALAEVQKQNDLIIRDMIKALIKEKYK